jgi:hypothetical protein
MWKSQLPSRSSYFEFAPASVCFGLDLFGSIAMSGRSDSMLTITFQLAADCCYHYGRNDSTEWGIDSQLTALFGLKLAIFTDGMKGLSGDSTSTSIEFVARLHTARTTRC